MAETFGFYDTEELVDGTYDREYIAQQWADYFKLFIGTGVFASPTNQLKVIAGEGMNIIVKQGWAFIEGRWYHNDADLILPVQPNTTPSTITSGVFIQADSANRVIKAVIATGRTTPDREAPYYELELAQIQLATGTTAITNSMITDMRTDESVCGFVKGLLEGVIPTADLFIQFTDMFNAWFDTIRDQLSEDAAGHLQNEIDELSDSVSEQIGIINAGLTANNHKFIAGYVDGEYGFYIDGVFRPFNSGTTYLGEFSANTTIDISELKGTPSAEDFIFVINESASIHKNEANYQNYASGYSKFYPASFSISGDTLSLSVPYERVYNFGDDREPGDHADIALKGKLYYRPSVIIGTYTSGQTIDVSAYRPLTVAQFVVAEVAEANTPNNGYTTHQNWGTVYAYYTKSTLTLSGNTLTVTAPKTSASVGGEENIKYKVCYLGKSLKFSKQGF